MQCKSHLIARNVVETESRNDSTRDPADAAINATSQSSVDKRIRNPWMVAAMIVLTFGIYGVYWWYESNRDLRDLGIHLHNPDLGENPRKSLLAVTIGLPLIVPPLLSVIGTCRRIRLAEDLLEVNTDANFFDQRVDVPGTTVTCIVMPPFGLMRLQASLNRIWSITGVFG